MAERVQRTCERCYTNVGFAMDPNDGYFYCGYCGSRADDIFDTGVEEDQFFSQRNIRTRVTTSNAIASEPISQVKPIVSQFMDHPPDAPVNDVGDGGCPNKPSDVGSTKNISYEDYYSEIRSRYVTGIQIMIQSQCKSLVEEFGVSPLIIGLIGPVWLRFLASSGVMAGEWADQAVHDSESQMMKDEGEEFLPSTQHRGDPTNIHGKRVAYVWFRSLRSTIPLPCTLAISFLTCHMAREAITPPDMIRWALEGKLPYFAVSDEIEKQIGLSSNACPIPAKSMFRPETMISSQKLESTAARIAQSIGLELPSVNFYGIASRFINELSLPVGDILPMACRMNEWSMPTELYLSANELRIPTRAFVMSIIIVTIRMIFNINGYGIWEKSFSNYGENAVGGDDDSSKLSVVKLLRMLEAKHEELDEHFEYSCDLPSYLKFCKDTVFSGLSCEDLEEEVLKECWDFYQSNENSCCHDGDQDSARCGQPSEDSSPKDEAIRLLKRDMDDNKFCYVPPRANVKSKDYVHYARRKSRRKSDMFVFAVHADYYILLRSCAKVARVETRVMHIAVLSLERRLQWLEKQVDSLLDLDFNFSDGCNFCEDDASEQNTGDATV